MFEQANPEPVAILGPVPSIQEQTEALMRDPSWLVKQMRMNEEAEDPQEYDWDDEEPEIFTGHEVIEMEPIVPPTYAPADQRGQDSPSKDQGLGPGSVATKNMSESNGDASTSPGSG